MDCRDRVRRSPGGTRNLIYPFVLAHLAALRQRLASGSHETLSELNHRLALLGRTLHSVSPLATLDRGYAIVRNPQGNVLTDAAAAKSGDEIRARLSKGELVANVTKVIVE